MQGDKKIFMSRPNTPSLYYYCYHHQYHLRCCGLDRVFQTTFNGSFLAFYGLCIKVHSVPGIERTALCSEYHSLFNLMMEKAAVFYMGWLSEKSLAYEGVAWWHSQVSLLGTVLGKYRWCVCRHQKTGRSLNKGASYLSHMDTQWQKCLPKLEGVRGNWWYSAEMNIGVISLSPNIPDSLIIEWCSLRENP